MRIIIEMIKGAIIGIANVIPGLSGGTLAVSMGIYEKLIYTVNNIFKTPIKCIKEMWTYIVGILVGIMISVVGIVKLLEVFPFPTIMLFIGLILGALPVITNKLEKKPIRVADAIIFIVFILIIVILPFFSGETVTIVEPKVSTYFMLFGLGVIAAATMVIPGISGSMILMVLGYYEYVMGTISGFIKSLLSFDFARMFTSATLLIPLGIGVILGIILISKIIGWLFEKHGDIAYWGILGLVVASPFPIILKMDITGINIWLILAGIISFGVGIYATKLLINMKER